MAIQKSRGPLSSRQLQRSLHSVVVIEIGDQAWTVQLPIDSTRSSEVPTFPSRYWFSLHPTLGSSVPPENPGGVLHLSQVRQGYASSWGWTVPITAFERRDRLFKRFPTQVTDHTANHTTNPYEPASLARASPGPHHDVSSDRNRVHPRFTTGEMC